MLRLRNLRIEKNGATICHVPELEVAAGECVAVVGANGCGKSTLLRVLSGLEEDVQGKCVVETPLAQRVYVHQAPYLFQGSVLCNATYGLTARGVTRQQRLNQARHWLTVFGVAHLADRSCEKLSGGERRRVALARAFAVRPDLLLLDEPLADLDSSGIEFVCQAIAAESETTVLIASPIPLPEALSTRTFALSAPQSIA